MPTNAPLNTEQLRAAALALPGGLGAETLRTLSVNGQVHEDIGKILQNEARMTAIRMSEGAGAFTLKALSKSYYFSPEERLALRSEAIEATTFMHVDKKIKILRSLAKSSHELQEQQKFIRIALDIPNGSGAPILEALTASLLYRNDQPNQPLCRELCKAAIALPNGAGAVILQMLANGTTDLAERNEVVKAALALPDQAGSTTLLRLAASSSDASEWHRLHEIAHDFPHVKRAELCAALQFHAPSEHERISIRREIMTLVFSLPSESVVNLLKPLILTAKNNEELSALWLVVDKCSQSKNENLQGCIKFQQNRLNR